MQTADNTLQRITCAKVYALLLPSLPPSLARQAQARCSMLIIVNNTILVHPLASLLCSMAATGARLNSCPNC